MDTEIILASASLRRRRLLDEAGYRFRVVPADIDESVFLSEKISPADFAKKAALAKAKKVAAKFPQKIVIAADTVADFNGQIIGKPADAEEAGRMLKKLFAGPHKVITGLAIVRISDGIELIEMDTTIVYPKKMACSEIDRHIKSGIWRGKAGAYAIQENGDEFIERIDGSISNVTGLPMELLRRMLAEIGG